VSSSQNLSRNLVLGSITYDAGTCGVVYRAIVGGEEIALEASVSDVAGIRSVQMSDELEYFLRSFCVEDPGVVKRLVRRTWQVVDGETLEYPVQI
jgi:hypothetical protein